MPVISKLLSQEGRAGVQRLLTAFVFANLLVGCLSGDDRSCPSGQDRICSSGDCRCGAVCRCNADCPSGQICGEYTYAPGSGVCIERGFGGVTTGLSSCGGSMSGTQSQCSPACDSNSVCAAVAGAPRCLRRCSSDSECSTCCQGNVGGVTVCAPSLSYCSMSPGGMTGNCSPACNAGSSCVTVDNVPRCLRNCASDSECSTCCTSTTNGTRVCAPAADFCRGSGGTCPAGTYPLYNGGPCVPPTPSSCPNDYIVCNCPRTHGIWCHPECQFPLNCGGTANPTYPCR